MIRSLRFRLAIGAVIAVLLSLATVWWSLSQLFTDYVRDRYVAEMTALADSVAAAAVWDKTRFTLNAAWSDSRLGAPAGGRYWQFEAKGQPALRSRSLWDTRLGDEPLAPSDMAPFETTAGPDGAPVLVLTRRSRLADAPEAGEFTVRVAFSEREMTAALEAFHARLRSMLLLTAAVLSAAAFIQAALGLTPLDRLRGVVARIRAGQAARLDDEGPLEVRPLVREINLLLDERETAVERARQRASDLAHGLKTPLTVLAQLTSRLDADAAELALRQIDLIRQRADRQLQAARLGVERMATSDVGALIGKLVQVLRPLTEDRGIDWRLDCPMGLSLEADPADLAEAIGNLLDNAAKWTSRLIEAKVRREEGCVIVMIGDDGPGLSEPDRAAMLARGASADAAGSGLGLAITADIAHAYGGDLTLGASPLGGLEARLSFPDRRG
ncbi:signal transduction histidine kinase [Rhizobium sp. SG_E_25_P2]|uniref:ATP-binding protein n=1 Tax=Rhizobium sp. SG_E_25_P2 TaxID=2879942 RepID=UPI002475D885|nr:ATP-binding protein [Rhizobium sp. SG_E_25_P2]MDH6269082.1 signal transduction histidine kinase [Rhizobium sp. SG_E_25_P2]